jgi:transposase
MRAEGASYRPGKLRLRTTAATIRRWKRRFATCGLDKSPRGFPR